MDDQIINETDGIHFVRCPLCHKELKVITMTHLKTHGYTSKEDFLNDYPGTQLMSKEYEDSNREIRSRVLTNLNRSAEQRLKSSNHAKELNKDSERQSYKGKLGWTPERRKEKSDQIKQMIYDTNNLPEYQEYRERRLKGFSYGKRIPYICEDGSQIVLRSFLECKTAKFLELNHIQFEYEKIEIKYLNTSDNTQRSYYPDFYLPKHNLLLEVKPLDYQEDQTVQDKKCAAEDAGYKFLFVSNDNLIHYKSLLSKINALGAK